MRPDRYIDSGWIGSWSPGLNDPSLIGWIVTLAYFVTALLCRARANAKPDREGPAQIRVVSGARQISRASTPRALPEERAFFRVTSWALLLLGANKQLDLQTGLLMLARELAHAFELEALKLPLQLGFVALLGLALVFVAWLVWVYARKLGGATRLAALGLSILFGFIVARAAMFEHLSGPDGVLRTLLVDTGLFELGGLACVALATRTGRNAHKAR